MQIPSSRVKSYSCFPVKQLKIGFTSILKDKIQISYAFLICSEIINIKKKLDSQLQEKMFNFIRIQRNAN